MYKFGKVGGNINIFNVFVFKGLEVFLICFVGYCYLVFYIEILN